MDQHQARARADMPQENEDADRDERETKRRVPRTYSSPAMAERRQRIIDTAHRILGDGGVPALTIARLSRDSDVAPRTIYRLFNDKDGVIFATVAHRMREVREHIAEQRKDYTLATVFAELEWMVSEMERDTNYARVVIDFNFSLLPRGAEIRELRSVAYNRFRNWMDREIRAGHTRDDLDLERIAQRHVVTEFLVYRRWAIGTTSSDECRIELKCCFLQTAAVILTGEYREEALTMLADFHNQLGMSEIGAGASVNRDERDVGEDYVGRGPERGDG